MRWLCFLQESNFLDVVHILGIFQLNDVLGLLLVEINFLVLSERNLIFSK
jgi:hypothetical protein